MKTNVALIAIAVSALSAPVALAKPIHRHHDRVAPVATHAPYYGGSRDGDIVAQAAERAQHEPGVTSEFAPDSRQTATGGPVGGIPGFEGGL